MYVSAAAKTCYGLCNLFIFMAGDGKAIVLYRCNLFSLKKILLAYMKEQPWDLNKLGQ